MFYRTHSVEKKSIYSHIYTYTLASHQGIYFDGTQVYMYVPYRTHSVEKNSIYSHIYTYTPASHQGIHLDGSQVYMSLNQAFNGSQVYMYR